MSYPNLLRISLLVFSAAFLLGGCALEEKNSAHAEGTLPWNRPQSWEGAGAMGAAMQGTP